MKKYSIKEVYILGINEALCASAALIKNGVIIAAAQEERFTRIKNCWGYPTNAINFCLETARIKPEDLDLLVLSYLDPYPHFVTGRAQERPNIVPGILKKLGNISPKIEYNFPFLQKASDQARRIYYDYYFYKNRVKQICEISKSLGLAKGKIKLINHHLCHAYTAYYSNPARSSKKTVILTNDGAGDQLAASVYLVESGEFNLLAKTPHKNSLGLFYSSITGYLGLKPHEDEYKIMGLAPYTENSDLSDLLLIFEKLIWVEGLNFNSLIPSRQFGEYLKSNLYGYRFDHIAAATQKHFENLMLTWINNVIKKTRAKRIVCAGGSFLNVKANMLINLLCQRKGIKCFFMPSPGDDTNAIGAAYYGFASTIKSQLPKSRYSFKTITNLYLGPEYSEKEIVGSKRKYINLRFKKVKNVEVVIAKLLAQGKIVARFSGKMEFGARALGNRSILADPRNRDVVEKINKIIKMRDFWMPFAPTIIDKYAPKYLVNLNHTKAPHMILAFDTTPLGKRVLSAAIHPYDKTARPQILNREENPEYYRIISEFCKLTGIGALLNTSFNIHGEPIVASPEDALSTLTRSGLEYLTIENYLVTKK